MARSARDLLFGTYSAGPVGDIGLLLLRVFAGLALAFAHGINKIPPSDGFVGMIGGMGMPAPVLFAWLAALAEFAGGILLALGLLTRPVAFVIAAHFVFVVFLAHAGDPFGDRELGAMFGVVALMYLFVGAGRHSVDAVLRSRT